MVNAISHVLWDMSMLHDLKFILVTEQTQGESRNKETSCDAIVVTKAKNGSVWTR